MAAVALPTFEPGFRFTTLAEAAAVVPEPAAAADPAAGMRQHFLLRPRPDVQGADALGAVQFVGRK